MPHRLFIFRADEDLTQAIVEACVREELTYSSLIRSAVRSRIAANEKESARRTKPDALTSRGPEPPADGTVY